MTCGEVSRHDIVEQYVLAQLGDEERDSFEQHYFECARCFELVRTYRDLQAELARTRESIVATPARSWIRQWAWLPAAAVVILVVSAVVRQRPGSTIVQPPSVESQPAATSAAPPAAQSSLDELARVEAPGYTEGRLRGATDDAGTKFREGMARYQQRDYTGARSLLREASALDPKAPHIAFFLGVSNLLAARPDEAVDSLRATIALGDSPYLAEAHFYLAKAYVKLGRVAEAIRELERTIRLGAEHEPEARLLLERLRVADR
jgi:tetratricopeptide (TPR) repeat protein